MCKQSVYSCLDYWIITLKNVPTKNKIHGEETLGIPSAFVYRSLKRDLKHLKKEVDGIEKRLLKLVKEDQQEQLTLLKSIPGMGEKTALFLLVSTDGFAKFERAGQLCSYVGITPTIRESGSSVRGRSRISKVGNKKLRNLLFLCAFLLVNTTGLAEKFMSAL